jgi:hypothetical protein
MVGMHQKEMGGSVRTCRAPVGLKANKKDSDNKTEPHARGTLCYVDCIRLDHGRQYSTTLKHGGCRAYVCNPWAPCPVATQWVAKSICRYCWSIEPNALALLLHLCSPWPLGMSMTSQRTIYAPSILEQLQQLPLCLRRFGLCCSGKCEFEWFSISN